MTQRFFACLRFAAPILLLACCAGSPAFAQDKTRADELSDQGDYFFKAGYYFRAADNYRLALLEDPTSPWKKLAFGHSLFATGQYGYASYALRKGVAELDPTQTLAPEVAALFPSRRRFQQALRDLKRYVTYSPRDPAGLTVLGYVLYTVRGEERRCRDLFRYLQKLDPNDAFARYFLDQLDRRGKAPPAPAQAAGQEVRLLLRDFEDEQVVKLRSALQVHPGVKALTPDEGGPYPSLGFEYTGKDSISAAVTNVLKSLGFPHKLRAVPTADKSGPLTFVLASPVARPKPDEPKESPAAPPAPAKPSDDKKLQEKLPAPKQQRERLENEWPEPAPAPAR
ncbi:MAG TPA: hypothetical protein DEA08_25660 [Planctomycetes bacterium]|nr:hypothetical protein [Planctomycetota bacterium]